MKMICYQQKQNSIIKSYKNIDIQSNIQKSTSLNLNIEKKFQYYQNFIYLYQSIQDISQTNMEKPQHHKKFGPKDRKQKLAPFYQFLSKLNILQDLTAHKILLSDNIQTDQIMIKKVSQIIEHVPLKFTSIQNYVHLWQKLFYEQAKCHIYRSKQQQAKQPQLVQILQLKDYEEISGLGFKFFKLQKLVHSQQRGSYNVGTLVVLSPVKPAKNTNYPHLVGFVQPGQVLTVKAVFDQSVKNRNLQEWELMTTTKKWYIQQICSINTLEREYYALTNVESISGHLLSLILRPDQHNKEIQKKFKIPTKLDHKLKAVFNQSQYRAISQCLKQEGVTLIQGPPGTGKTKTVLGTLSVLLSSYKKNEDDEEEPLVLNWTRSASVSRDTDKLLNPWLENGYIDWRDAPYIQNDDDPLNLTSCYLRCDLTDRRIVLTKKQEGIELPEKVLICGPSNASVDQIIRKLLKQQLIDKDGHTYMPNFVRVGEHYDPSLRQYSLEYLVQKMAQKDQGTDLSIYRSKIINENRLIFATLSAAGNQVMDSSNIQFDTVVIDQAGQSIQISNLIPLMYGCQRLILIGDPNQLPATVFSQKSLEHNYDQSLFQRLMKSGYPVNILKTQYRMHPDISYVIGNNFYGQKLNNWDHMIVEEPKVTTSAFVIFHIDQAPEIAHKKSFRNMVQAKAVKDFAAYLSKFYDDIGVVSPYSQQVALIQSLIGKNKKCQVKTIDSFQGREKDVILFSAVRSRFTSRYKKIEENRRKTIGFVSDLRRINVSLSRAKSLCVIFCDAKRLCINSTWKNIINDAMTKNQLFQFNHKKNFFQSFKEDPKKYCIESFQ